MPFNSLQFLAYILLTQKIHIGFSARRLQRRSQKPGEIKIFKLFFLKKIWRLPLILLLPGRKEKKTALERFRAGFRIFFFSFKFYVYIQTLWVMTDLGFRIVHQRKAIKMAAQPTSFLILLYVYRELELND